MRPVALVLFSIVMSSRGVAFAQAEPAARNSGAAAARQEEPEEVVVRGRRVGELRLEVELKRQRAYEIFNEINSHDDFDVSCKNENASGTRMRRQVCRAQFEDKTAAAAGREYFSSLIWQCREPGGVTADCVFSDASAAAISAAQGVETGALHKRDEMNEEIFRLANENDEFAQAILDFYEASQQYEKARKRRDD